VTPYLAFERVWKKFKRGQTHDSLRDLVPAMARRLIGRPHVEHKGSSRTFWALRDLSFEVKPGEVLGIIGSNGAGKSTTLKILNRIMDPTAGTVRTEGRIGALIEVSAGFHQDLTGRQNIFLQGAIMGMRKAEVERKFDEIVAFAGIDDFLDTPVKRYSSGMNARLGFSIAAHLEPDILIIDEVLAVGDAAFQQKAFGRIKQMATGGAPVVLVSHQLDRIAELCTKAIVLDHGATRVEGAPLDCINAYLHGIARTTPRHGFRGEDTVRPCVWAEWPGGRVRTRDHDHRNWNRRSRGGAGRLEPRVPDPRHGDCDAGSLRYRFAAGHSASRHRRVRIPPDATDERSARPLHRRAGDLERHFE
jgi:ABC-type polysaccharide/polyol phosphate transport system ATPase subunit